MTQGPATPSECATLALSRPYDPGQRGLEGEGDPYPWLAQRGPAQHRRRATGESYWFFQNAFGRDSYDAAGHKMEIVNSYCAHLLSERQLDLHHHPTTPTNRHSSG